MFRLNFLKVLLFLEFWERLSYSCIQSVLVLFLTSHFSWSDSKAYAVYGLFLSISYALPILGGYMADRWIGFRRMITMGSGFMLLGYSILLLSINYKSFIFYALAFIAVGTGLFKVSTTSLLGLCYSENDSQREYGFTLFYLSISLGGFLASIIGGYTIYFYGWFYGFSLSFFGMVLGLAPYLILQKKVFGLQGLSPTPIYDSWRPLILIIGGLLIAALALALILQKSNFSSNILAFLWVGLLPFLKKVWQGSTYEERRALIRLAFLILFSLFFFSILIHIGSFINLFTARNVSKTLLGVPVPASLSQSIVPFIILFFGPILSVWFLKKKRRFFRFGVGLLSIVVCFALLSLGCSFPNEQGRISFIWLVLGLMIFGIGDICFVPFIQAYVVKLSPSSYKGSMMGFLMLSVSYASLLGSFLPKLLVFPDAATDPYSSLSLYQTIFFKISLLGVILYLAFLGLCLHWRKQDKSKVSEESA